MDIIHLKHKRDRSLRRCHPWIFSGSIDYVTGQPGIGETVDVQSAEGKDLGKAAYSPASAIRARMWTFDPISVVNDDFFYHQLKKSIARRNVYFKSNLTNAFRLVHGESDGLPGLIVDRYADYLVVQFLSAGVEFWRKTILSSLIKLTGFVNIYERSDQDVRSLEGLEERVGLLSGENPAGPIPIRENNMIFDVDIRNGQKTGFYLDQRNNRIKIKDYAKGCKVLDCFSYTGGFCIHALAAGANHVTTIDSSVNAILQAQQNLAHNSIDSHRVTWIEGDVFQELRKQRDREEKYDLIILDPPKFAPTISQSGRASRGYKDINLLAFKLLKPDGILFTFSCSGGVTPLLFQQIVAGAALDAGVCAVILEKLGQPSDHPIALNFPEGEYLKGLICQI